MLQIREIFKKYVTGDLQQTALDKVSLNLRDNEFVAILGPSGSGKTTLLNIIGGLDRYDEGDLIINGISTKKYKDRDWDSYRNHTVGFVFQSYNLIPHQSVLANVELALTISGISKGERRRRAKEALERVGLGNQYHKKPNQMSGGQMQRVAIARALVNNPDILLADEPTGALDTDTSVQVMELLKEVAKDRLVVMVTHNPELAEEYATRIVKLRDGKVLEDSDPYMVDEATLETPEHKNMGKASMAFSTALALSFNNLRTKKGRTILTAFAGSIGIIGIALILSISNGVSTYIEDIQKETMTSYPVMIQAQTIDLNNLLENNMAVAAGQESHDREGIYADGTALEMISGMTTSITENNLTEFKKYLDSPESEINQYIGETGIVYTYDTRFGIYTYDPDGMFVNTDGSTLEGPEEGNVSGMTGSGMDYMSEMSQMGAMIGVGASLFAELLPGRDGAMIHPMIVENYDVVYGDWPKSYDEVVLVLDRQNELPSNILYQLGVLPTAEYREVIAQIEAGEEITLEPHRFDYEDICNKEYRLIPACDTYVEQENGKFVYVGSDEVELEKLMEEAMLLKIVGIVRPAAGADNQLIRGTVGYTSALTDYLIEYTGESPVVRAQETNKETNVLSGLQFAPENEQVRIQDAKTYLANLSISEKAQMGKVILQSMSAMPQMSRQIPGMGGVTLEQIGALDEVQLAALTDQYLANPREEVLLAIYDNYISPGTYDDNMAAFGLVSPDAPSSISIYVDSFEAKDGITASIQKYNQTAREQDKISYTDYVGLILSSVTTIINVISYVLIAFVGVSLVVSSIMIGIITYISVLERTKEIGILRAIGASKHNISQVFNAETFIIGLCSGFIGVGVTLLLLIPANAVIHVIAESEKVNASLPVGAAVILVILSVVLTLIGGIIPSKKAALQDPVTALRTD